MLLEMVDFNGANDLFNGELSAHWQDIKDVLEGMALHLKASDQAGLQGNAIFDPVGTNECIKHELTKRKGWTCNVPIPEKFKFLGTDVDFVNGSLLVEVQFSNYPFLLNNLLRSELFFQAATSLGLQPVKAAIIVTKAHMFPASNSTLYYEQAHRQLSALAEENVYDVPIRLVGLFSSQETEVDAVWTGYHASRYSRTVVTRETRRFFIAPPRTRKSRAMISAPNDEPSL